MRLSDGFQEFINYATLERCLQPTTISWYQQTIKPFFKYQCMQIGVRPRSWKVIDKRLMKERPGLEREVKEIISSFEV